MKKRSDVFDVIKSDERYTILAEILDSTGIGEAMSNERQAFTFFAPVDDAFKNLPEKVLSYFRMPEGAGLLAAILSQHIVPQSYFYATDLRRQSSVKTLRGNKLKINKVENILSVETAHIMVPGVAAANAVVFPVDRILPVPRKFTIV